MNPVERAQKKEIAEKKKVKNFEASLNLWGRVFRNRPIYDNLSGELKDVADYLLTMKYAYINPDGEVRASVSGGKMIKKKRKELKKYKRENERN